MLGEVAQRLEADECKAPRLVSMKPSSIPRVVKILAILAREVLDGLLLRIGIQINDGPLDNVLNMALCPVLKQ